MVKTATFSLGTDPLAGLESLKARVAIYVPTTASSQVVGYQREKAAEAFGRYFGGFTEIKAFGGWFSETKGATIREEVFVIYANTTPTVLARCLPAVIRLAGQMAQSMEQECVSLEVNGSLYFVPPSKAVLPV